jgi:hypothetical protein
VNRILAIVRRPGPAAETRNSCTKMHKNAQPCTTARPGTPSPPRKTGIPAQFSTILHNSAQSRPSAPSQQTPADCKSCRTNPPSRPRTAHSAQMPGILHNHANPAEQTRRSAPAPPTPRKYSECCTTMPSASSQQTPTVRGHPEPPVPTPAKACPTHPAAPRPRRPLPKNRIYAQSCTILHNSAQPLVLSHYVGSPLDPPAG